ncbi:hypothetical protein IIA29_02385 [candidate division KSB1 bacterium]|nr:hypothetical protein [candidate division KSB1 bacterium]
MNLYIRIDIYRKEHFVMEGEPLTEFTIAVGGGKLDYEWRSNIPEESFHEALKEVERAHRALGEGQGDKYFRALDWIKH